MQIGAFLRLAKAVFALDLDMVEAMRQLETLDFCALGYGRPVGHEREFDAARFQRIDRVMRAGKDEHLLFAVGREAVGEPNRQVLRQRPAGRGERGKSASYDFVAGFLELEPPFGPGVRPELARRVEDRSSDLLRR